VWDDTNLFLGGYFGIPWINFAGWTLSATVITALVTRFIRLDPLPAAPLIFIYIAVWLLETGGQAFLWDLSGSALVGFLGMGIFVTLAVRVQRT
jgi:putative membrane protein